MVHRHLHLCYTGGSPEESLFVNANSTPEKEKKQDLWSRLSTLQQSHNKGQQEAASLTSGCIPCQESPQTLLGLHAPEASIIYIYTVQL